MGKKDKLNLLRKKRGARVLEVEGKLGAFGGKIEINL
jgi:hypothetical protein